VDPLYCNIFSGCQWEVVCNRVGNDNLLFEVVMGQKASLGNNAI
jgi:hypothetical protein